MGLTTIDVVNELTVGRGGCFIGSGDGKNLHYMPSGKEPLIYIWSRTGVYSGQEQRIKKQIKTFIVRKFLHLIILIS